MIGAGGGFGAELMESGISDAIARAAVDMHVPLLVLAWGLAAGMRVAVGSATVAMSTTAGIVAPSWRMAPRSRPSLWCWPPERER